MIALFAVGRGVVEVFTLDPADRASYRQSWGGPSYIGVLLVHAGPGALILVIACVLVVRRRRRVRFESRP